jgi:hypothetical protein
MLNDSGRPLSLLVNDSSNRGIRQPQAKVLKSPIRFRIQFDSGASWRYRKFPEPIDAPLKDLAGATSPGRSVL